MTADLRALAAWLTGAGCQLAAMESTGSYWKPVWNVLEGQVALLLANAKQVRALPGEKTDRKDGRRLADLVRHGLVRASFVPPRNVRELRDLTRYRTKLLGNGAAERNRIQKILEDANIKLGSVLSDVFGASGQRLLEALLAGHPVALAEVVRLTHWRLAPKVEQIQHALEGHVTAHHRFLIEACLDHMRYLERQIARLDERIAQCLHPYAQAYALLQTIPGLAESSAATVIAEIGADMAGLRRRGPPRLVGGALSGQQRKRWQTLQRKNSQRESVPPRRPRQLRVGCNPEEAGPVPRHLLPHQSPAGIQARRGRRGA